MRTEDIPATLIAALPDDVLDVYFARLKRTRRRIEPFYMNATKVVTPRKYALDLVKAEIERRKNERL